MYPDLIEIFGVRISTYGVLVAAGLLVAYFTAVRLARRENIPAEKAESVLEPSGPVRPLEGWGQLPGGTGGGDSRRPHSY